MRERGFFFVNKVARNASWIIGCKIVQSIFALVINMLTARFLGPSNYGVITYASSLVAFVVPVMQLGFNSILVQELVNNPENEGKTIGTSLLLSLICSVCCIIGVTAFSMIANRDETVTIVVCFLYSLLLIFQAMEMIEYWFQAKLLSKYTSLVSLCAYSVVAAYKVHLVITAKHIYWFAVSTALDYALIAISSLVIYYKLGGQKLSFSWEIGKAMLARSKHYIISGMMVTVFAQTDKIMTKLMIDEAATGYYGAAVATAGLTGFVFNAIINSFRPSIFEGLKVSQEVFEHRLITLYSIVIYVSLAQCIVMTVLAMPVIYILYGADYLPSVSTLQIVVWYTTFSYVGAVRNIWILANNKQHYLWKINLSGAAMNIVINAILIPMIGINGAAIASVFSQFFTNVVIGYIYKDLRTCNALMIKGLNYRYLIDVMIKMEQPKGRD